MGTELRRAVSGQSTRSRVEHDGAVITVLRANALTHLTDGTRNSPSGRNLRALCGASVLPEVPAGMDDARLCPKCEANRRNQGA